MRVIPFVLALLLLARPAFAQIDFDIAGFWDQPAAGVTSNFGFEEDSNERAGGPALVDYLGVGPVFATDTKRDAAPPMGVAGLAAIRRATALPLVAIGGLGPGNAAAAIRAGADGVAVVSAICGAADPHQAAENLAGEVASAKRARDR